MTAFSSLYTGRLDRELHTDDSTQLFTTARRKAAVNEGLEHFADITECWTKQSTISITAGTAEYDLHSSLVIAGEDFLRFHKEQVQFRYTDASSNVTVLAGDDLPRRDVEWLNRFEPSWQVSTEASSIAKLPQVYYHRTAGGAGYLGFWPTPGLGSSASAAVIVPYIARPVPLTADTSQPFTDTNGVTRRDLVPFHQAAVHYAAAQLEKLRADMEASNAQMQTFLSFVTRYLGSKRVKGGRHVTFARNYWQTRGREVVDDPRT